MELKWKHVGTQKYEAKVGMFTVLIRKDSEGWAVYSNVGDILHGMYQRGGYCRTLRIAQDFAETDTERALAKMEAEKPKSEAERLREALERIAYMTASKIWDASQLRDEIRRIAEEALSK